MNLQDDRRIMSKGADCQDSWGGLSVGIISSRGGDRWDEVQYGSEIEEERS